MPIQLKPTMLEMTAMAAAQQLARQLLGMAEDSELAVTEVAMGPADDFGIRQVDVGLKSGKRIAVRLSKRRRGNPERDERWYAVSAWLLNTSQSNCALLSYFRQTNVSSYHPPVLAPIRRTNLERAKRQQKVVLRKFRRDKSTTGPTIKELFES